MGKFIKITAILAVVSAILDLVLGKVLIPFIYFLVVGQKWISGEYSLTAIIFYSGLRFFDLARVLLIIVFAVLIILGIRSMSEKIITEVAGLILFICYPFAGLIQSLITTSAITLMAQTVGAEFIGAFNILNSMAGYTSTLQSIAIVLITVSLTASLCRKRWARDDEFDKG